MNNATLSVPTISCDHCKSTIEGAVGPMDGVASVDVAIDAAAVVVTYDESVVELDDIVAVIEESGYDVAR